MLIAMPVKMNKQNPPLTTVFGKAKWFAFADDGGTVEIRENPYAGAGPKTVSWLVDAGVDTVVTQHIGGNPFMIMKDAGIRIFYPGEGRILVDEVLEKMRNGGLEEITVDNIMRFTQH